MDALNAKLEAALLADVRALRLVPWATSPSSLEERVVVSSRLARLCAVVTDEHEGLVSSDTAVSAAGTHSGGATLWDGHTMAVRLLIENAKINLILRVADDHVDGRLRARPAESCANELEGALESLLVAAWQHREALQVTDTPLALDVLARAMLVVCAGSHAEPSARIASLALSWMGVLGSTMALSALGEAKLVSDLVRAGVFVLLPFFFCAPSVVAAPPAARLAAAAGAAAWTASEEFAIRAKPALQKGGADAAICALIAHAAALPAEGSSPALWARLGALSPFAEGARAAKASLSALALAAPGGVSGVAAARRSIRPLLDFFDSAAK